MEKRVSRIEKFILATLILIATSSVTSILYLRDISATVQGASVVAKDS